MDGDKQDPGYLHRAGSCFRHRAWAPRRRPGLGLSALAVPLPLLLCLAVFSRSGPAGRGACIPVRGTPQHLLGGPAAVALSHYAGGLKYTYRYCINDCCVLYLYCTVLRFHGSSITIYSPFLNTNYSTGWVQLVHVWLDYLCYRWSSCCCCCYANQSIN